MTTTREYHAGRLMPYADGGYPYLYVDKDSEPLCAACATEAVGNGEQIAVSIFYEGAPEHCGACNAELRSMYGDPDAEERDATWDCPHCQGDQREVGFQEEQAATVTYRYRFTDDDVAQTDGYSAEDVTVHGDRGTLICGSCGEELPYDLSEKLRATMADEHVARVEVTA